MSAKRFGEHLRKTRESAGVSLRALARRCDLSPAYISLVELGKSDPPTANVIEQIAAVLKCDADDLVFRAGRLPSDVAATIQRYPKKVTQVLRFVGLTKITGRRFS